ncbi:MAG: flagellar assembly protein FliW [Bacillota bacterium]|nr:flagellar assembly protein FliW [Bacillota bacterium]
MQVKTSRFGSLEVAPERLIRFPRGMVGFPGLKEYFFVPVPENTVFAWMQAKDDPDVAFLMVDPFVFYPDYQVELSEGVCHFLQLRNPGEATLLTVVTIPAQGVKGMTTNLLAPVVINHVKGLGQQVVLETGEYHTKHPLFRFLPPTAARRACG